MRGMSVFIILFLTTAFFTVNAQSVQTLRTAVYEYASVEYNAESGLITISARDEKGEIYTFHFSEKDNIKNAELLFSPSTPRQTKDSINYTRTKLLGRKIKISAFPVGEIDPASPYCCYLIKEVTFLDAESSSD